MPWQRRPRVNKVCPPLRHESGPRRSPSYRPDRVAVVAHWSQSPEVSRSVVELVGQLRAHDYDVIISSAATCPQPLEWPGGPPEGVSVYRRPNIGYDFGSWAQALDLLPGIRSARTAVLANDSLVGPFASLSPILTSLDQDDHPVWGLVSTSQDAFHLQSHFVAYRDGILCAPELRRFWDDVRVERTKAELIRRYEIGLAPVLNQMGVTYGAGFPWESVVVQGGNPTSAGWRRLMLSGFPFVKRELVLRPPPEVPDAADIPDVVRALFGHDVNEWV